MKAETKKQTMYNLNYTVRQEGLRVNVIKRTVYISHLKCNELSKNVIRLQSDFGYSVQTEIE